MMKGKLLIILFILGSFLAGSVVTYLILGSVGSKFLSGEAKVGKEEETENKFSIGGFDFLGGKRDEPDQVVEISGWLTYTNSQSGFSIQYPGDWVKSVDFPAGSASAVGFENGLKGGEKIEITVIGFLKTQETAEELEVFERISNLDKGESVEFEAGDEKVKYTKEDEFKIEGKKAVRFSSVSTDGTNQSAGTGVVVDGGEKMFVLILGKGAGSPEAIEVFEKMLTTFKIL